MYIMPPVEYVASYFIPALVCGNVRWCWHCHCQPEASYYAHSAVRATLCIIATFLSVLHVSSVKQTCCKHLW